MEASLLLWLASSGALFIVAAYTVVKIQREAALAGRQIHRCAVHQRELLQIIENHRLLQDVQNVTESLVDEGTSVVRTIHKEIASIPFEILESIPQTRDTTKIVRGVHDVASDGVYAGISIANRMLGRQVRKKMRVSELSEADQQGKPNVKLPDESKKPE